MSKVLIVDFSTRKMLNKASTTLKSCKSLIKNKDVTIVVGNKRQIQ